MVEQGSCSINYQLTSGSELFEECAAQCVGVASQRDNKLQVVRLDGRKEMATVEAVHCPITLQALTRSKGEFRIVQHLLGRVPGSGVDDGTKRDRPIGEVIQAMGVANDDS